MAAALFVTVLLIAACGLVYELVAGALASYLLGDSVTQFSTVIGTYLFAMGIGSWLSRYVTRGLAALLYALLGIVIFVVAFVAIEKMTPGTLSKELLEDQNTALAILLAGLAIAVAIIIAAAIH